VPVFARAYDRRSSMQLVREGVDYQIRETFESAIKFGEEVLVRLGVAPEEAAETVEDVRRRDRQRLELQIAGDIQSGNALFKGNMPVPTPLQPPRQAGRALNEETAAALDGPSASR
jgi:glutathione-regulated potassium-efflux system protein KefB